MTKVHYSELTPGEFRRRLAGAPIAYLPLGTLEWHGEHLPLGSDGLQSRGFFEILAREVGGIVLPMIFLGPDRETVIDGKSFYGMDTAEVTREAPFQLPGSAYWVDHDLFRNLLEAVLKQLRRAGFRIVVAHGHGPSTSFFYQNHGEWMEKFDLDLYACWREGESDGLGIMTDHAAANETSLMMALHPDLVQMMNLDPRPEVWPNGVGGKDPRIHASAAVGHKALRMQADRMAGILREALQRVRGASAPGQP